MSNANELERIQLGLTAVSTAVPSGNSNVVNILVNGQ